MLENSYQTFGQKPPKLFWLRFVLAKIIVGHTESVTLLIPSDLLQWKCKTKIEWRIKRTFAFYIFMCKMGCAFNKIRGF
ncbi:hypothetical protein OAG_04395 [Vibrio cyclitrophicus FF75]|nr:hypothetical protein OAG_04395 [Vibrio cyclitrophicus FF75]PMO10462.1 hypothetical protein BCT18_18145 [Vibrio cyclitrophicus]